MNGHEIGQIAQALGFAAEGNLSLKVSRLAEPAEAGPEDLAVALEPRYGEGLAAGRARAAILWPGADWRALGLEAVIFVERPRLGLAALTAHFDAPEKAPGWPGIHPLAAVDEGAELGVGAQVGPFAVIGPGVRVGARARIGAHVTIAAGAEIGDDAVLHPGVHIGRRVRIGKRFFAHSGVVVGADGFSFVTAERSHVEEVRENLGSETAAAGSGQPWLKIRSLGGVEIGDDVEIGANSSVDAGTIRPTRVGAGTKIDALVQVGHNVQVGRNCLLCAHVAVGGSARLGDNVVLGGQAGVADNIRLGDGVVAGGATKILSNVPAGRALLGYPAMKMENHIESYKALRRLPKLFRDVARLKKSVSKTGDND